MPRWTIGRPSTGRRSPGPDTKVLSADTCRRSAAPFLPSADGYRETDFDFEGGLDPVGEVLTIRVEDDVARRDKRLNVVQAE